MEWKNGSTKKIYRTTIDYHLYSENPVKPGESVESTVIIRLSKTTGTIALDHSLPLLAYLSPADSKETKIIWSSEGDDRQEYKAWPTQLNVEKNKTWKITFALPYYSGMGGHHAIYVLDRTGNEITQSFYYSGDERTTTLTIKPNKNYIPGESYTLFIKNILGRNGEVLEQSVKVDFTIKKES
ncbi:predicted RNA-binding protein homologous to eukaryotic snRNP [Solibacillus silvestris StLB046]|uniref:Predicted RNA-binding protein homologous to eukaryotic snRNP n=1 Tax=Solibacillus silvestris (strain StLB046) TaxID=1002809 RepID=F2F3W7_SOLSS|nr:hypothetical protein [Solibacillus silvestris]BAK17765.1 predicted RNA-binding protein homologous to eukaryotic snRNP [Solibacillus silvestris StLB046]